MLSARFSFFRPKKIFLFFMLGLLMATSQAETKKDTFCDVTKNLMQWAKKAEKASKNGPKALEKDLKKCNWEDLNTLASELYEAFLRNRGNPNDPKATRKARDFCALFKKKTSFSGLFTEEQSGVINLKCKGA